MFFRNNDFTLDHSLFFTYFTKVFVHVAVCYFSVYRLIGWDPANIDLFKVNIKTLEKGVTYSKVNN